MELKWIAWMVLLVAPFVVMCGWNGRVFFLNYMKRQPAQYWIPVAGGVLGMFVFVTSPWDTLAEFWWAAPVLDWGSVGTIHAFVMRILRRDLDSTASRAHLAVFSSGGAVALFVMLGGLGFSMFHHFFIETALHVRRTKFVCERLEAASTIEKAKSIAADHEFECHIYDNRGRFGRKGIRRLYCDDGTSGTIVAHPMCGAELDGDSITAINFYGGFR